MKEATNGEHFNHFNVCPNEKKRRISLRSTNTKL